MKRKLHSASGETLVETMAAILIVTLASLLFLTMLQTTTRLNAGADEADESYQADLNAAELQDTGDLTGSGTVTVRRDGAETAEYSVDYYRTADGGLTSYARGDGS